MNVILEVSQTQLLQAFRCLFDRVRHLFGDYGDHTNPYHKNGQTGRAYDQQRQTAGSVTRVQFILDDRQHILLIVPCPNIPAIRLKLLDKASFCLGLRFTWFGKIKINKSSPGLVTGSNRIPHKIIPLLVL